MEGPGHHQAESRFEASRLAHSRFSSQRRQRLELYLLGYLSKVSPEFQGAVGHSDSPKWPVGDSIQRSQDLHEKIAGTPGSIGYTELNLAVAASLHTALIQNVSGDFVKPSRQAIAQAALADAGKASASSKTSLINAPGKGSYPISSYSWIYVPAVAKDAERGRAVAEFLKWTYGSGQVVVEQLGYATLPHEILANAALKAATLR